MNGQSLPERAEAGEATRADRLYASVVESIIDGEFPPGERLPSETALAERFGVSRPIVREALARLRDHGLIYSRRGSGSYVHLGPKRELLRFAPVGNIADIQRCMEFRVAVESQAAAHAAERHDPRSMAEIDQTVSRLEAVIQGSELGVDSDLDFHRAVARASRNAYFLQTIEMLDEQVRTAMTIMRNLSLLRPAARLRLVQDEHLAVVAAIRARDSAAAAQAMARHIDNARRRMLEG